MEETQEEEIIEWPTSVVEAFHQKLTKESQNDDLPLSPISEKKKKRSKSSDYNNEAMERLYVSPSPFKSPEDLK